MTALADDRSLDQQDFGVPSIVQGGVDGGTCLYQGAFAAPLTATGYLAVGGGVASTNAVMGISSHRADNTSGSDGDISANLANGVFARPNSTGAALTQAHFGKPCYAEDSQTLRNAGGATYPLAGVCLGLNDEGEVLVFVSAALNYLLSQGALETALASILNGQGASMIGVEDAALNFTAADVEAALAEIMTLMAGITGATGGNLVGYDDSGTKTTAATVANALDELYVHETTAQGIIEVPLPAFRDADGDPLVKFADGASTVPGWNVADSEALGLRWNNHGTPDPVVGSVGIPEDLDETAALVLHIMASKTGNTLADAVTFTVTAFFQTVGALHDADADCGGTSSAMTGDSAAKTVQEETLSIAAGDVPAPPANLTFTLQPTDGKLDTDDVIVERVWFEYTKRILSS